MNLRSRFTVFFLLISVVQAGAQQMYLSRLFYPNITFRAEHNFPAQTSSGNSFGLTRYSMLGITPLQSEVQVGYSLRKKLDIKAIHTLMLAQYTQLQPTVAGVRTPDEGYKTAALAVIRLQASWRDRLWVYGGGVGLTESNETFFTPQPYIWGGAARLRIFGLQSQLMYGSILVYSQKIRVVPILGFNKRFARKWRATAILPFTVDLNYRASKFFNFEAIAGVNGYSAGYKIAQPNTTELAVRRENYQHVKVGLAANVHLASVFNISAEAGLTTFRSLKNFNSARQVVDPRLGGPDAAPYVGVSLRYISSRSRISSQFTNKLGLGSAGIGW